MPIFVGEWRTDVCGGDGDAGVSENAWGIVSGCWLGISPLLLYRLVVSLIMNLVTRSLSRRSLTASSVSS